MTWFLTLVPDPFETVRLTVYVPPFTKVTDGFCRVEVLPLPKFQENEVGLPVEVLVKFTCRGAHPLFIEVVKLATNCALSGFKQKKNINIPIYDRLAGKGLMDDFF